MILLIITHLIAFIIGALVFRNNSILGEKIVAFGKKLIEKIKSLFKKK